MNQQTLFSLVRAAFWSAGLVYATSWAVVVWFIYDGSIIVDNPACQPVHIAPLVYWTCDSGAIAIFLVTALNAVLTVTVWAPVTLMVAWLKPEFMVFAVMLVMMHVIGFSAMVHVGWRLIIHGYDGLRSVVLQKMAGSA